MRHVKWDEEGLNAASKEIESIVKRPNRPPPEPKTPFHQPNEEGAVDEMKLSGGSGNESFKDSSSEDDFSEDVQDVYFDAHDGDHSKHQEFITHRKQHYKGDGEALHCKASDEDLLK